MNEIILGPAFMYYSWAIDFIQQREAIPVDLYE